MRTIPLTQGFVTCVSAQGYQRAAPYKWCAHREGRRVYAVRNSPRIDGKQKFIYLHRFLTDAPRGLQVDHIDGDSLNNIEENLRLATASQNRRGFCLRKRGCSSLFRGVSWSRASKKWKATIKVNGCLKHLGYFFSENEAARAYDAAAKQFFGGFTQPNFR